MNLRNGPPINWDRAREYNERQKERARREAERRKPKLPAGPRLDQLIDRRMAMAEVVARVLDPDNPLSPAAKLVAIAIGERLNDPLDLHVWQAWPSATDIARRTKLCERTVRTKIKEILRLKAPLFSVTRGGKVPTGHEVRANIYQLVRDRDAHQRAYKRRQPKNDAYHPPPVVADPSEFVDRSDQVSETDGPETDNPETDNPETDNE